MAKKLLIVFMLVISVAFLVFGGKFVKDSGVFEPYPDAEYLKSEKVASRPVYEFLDEKEKAVYSALYNGVDEKKTEIPLPYEVSGDVYSKIYCIFEKQEGGFFYIDSTYYTAEKVRNAQIVLREDTDGISQKITEFEQSAEKALLNAPTASDYEKALYIHDYIINTCEYNVGEDYKYSSTAYGCLVDGQANCEGYAKAFSYLAERMGLVSVLVTGKTDKGENHAWNQVKIDGEWYNLDVTWDDMDIPEEARKVYFLCNDDTFVRTHIAENTYFQPFECTATENNYYVKNGLFANNAKEADDIIRREIARGNTRIDLKFSDADAYRSFKKDYVEGQLMFDIVLESGYSGGEQISVTLRETEEEYCLTLNFS
ncbi:MAG: hypothetical protein K2I06_04455 [Ruminococcus sp.]|nr:hypothetical protein [Ruminococcus sp.]